MKINKITPSVDYNYWLKSLDPFNQNSINQKSLSQQINFVYQCNLQSNVPSLFILQIILRSSFILYRWIVKTYVSVVWLLIVPFFSRFDSNIFSLNCIGYNYSFIFLLLIGWLHLYIYFLENSPFHFLPQFFCDT